MKTISVLGSGWLGLPLAQHFMNSGFAVKASTTSARRVAELSAIGVEPYIVDIDSLTDEVDGFLQAHTLIINITSKNLAGFQQLAAAIVAAGVEHVLFVSSTSVYRNVQATITEQDSDYYSQSPLLDIERLFTDCDGFATTVVRFGGLIGYTRHPGRFFKPGSSVQNPDSPVNLIHRDDCIGIISQIIAQGLWGEVLNCTADTHPSKRVFYTQAVQSLGGSLPNFGVSDEAAGKLISNEKVKRLLNYDFKHSDVMNVYFQPTAGGE